MTILEKLFTGLCVLLSIGFLYIAFVYVPVGFITQAECLSKGYPKYDVTIGLESYCMTLDGAVTVEVEKLGEAK